MEDKIEAAVDELQQYAAIRCEKETERAKAYRSGYEQGIEDLHRFLRQNGVKVN